MFLEHDPQFGPQHVTLLPARCDRLGPCFWHWEFRGCGSRARKPCLAGDAELLRGVERLRSVPRPLVFRELWLQTAACYGKALISHPQSEADLEGAIWCLQSTAVLDDTEEPGATLTESLQVQVWYFYCTFCAGCGQTRRL